MVGWIGQRLDQDSARCRSLRVGDVYRASCSSGGLYNVREWRNATGVLTTACPNEWADIVAILREFRLYRSEIQAKGGNRSPISRRLDGAFYSRGWIEKDFATAILIDDRRFDSPTDSVDCFKGRVAVEVEWNNKDPFFDRDLNNFRLLFGRLTLALSLRAAASCKRSSISLTTARPTAGRSPTTKS
jgi:hypothetical protein